MSDHKSDLSIDLTPEEFAQVFGESAGAGGQSGKARNLQISAVLGAHLNGRQFERVKEYARHLAGECGRVGLIELDASEFRLMCFDASPHASQPDEAQTIECYDARQMAEALEEMSWDIRRWLLLVPSPRTPEAKALLRTVNHWVLLSTCDHDGIVSSYRLLKGLADGQRPRLSLALLDGADDAEVNRVYRKVSGVCEQFLNWPVENEPAVRAVARASEHLVLCCRPIHNKAQLATAPQWSIVADFVASAQPAVPEHSKETQSTEDETMLRAAEEPVKTPAHVPTIEAATPASVSASAAPAVQPPAPASQPMLEVPAPLRLVGAPAVSPQNSVADVLELHGDDPASILGAVLHQTGDLVECPVRPPMCGDARLAVSRDRGVVLLAVARQGLTELRSIAQAYRWMVENRTLLGMALPQFAIDTQRMPRLRLLVDQADTRADLLQPMLESEHVSVQAYRRLRWGGKMGLFLDAA